MRLFKFGWCLFVLSAFASQADAKKCPPGQYGVFKCIKCPKDTYAYKDHILTGLGCKKCPSGTFADPGWRRCKPNKCYWHHTKRHYKAGETRNNHVNGKKEKCTRAQWVAVGDLPKSNCVKSWRDGFKASGDKNFRHGAAQCSYKAFGSYKKYRKYKCLYGAWIEVGGCDLTPCRYPEPVKRIAIPLKHGQTYCHRTTGSKTYGTQVVCKYGRVEQAGKCPPTACRAKDNLGIMRTYKHHQSECNLKEKKVYKCAFGVWQPRNSCIQMACKAKDNNGVLRTFRHYSSPYCVVRERRLYRCLYGVWLRGATCPPAPCYVRIGTTSMRKKIRHNQPYCEPNKKQLHLCLYGTWKNLKQPCRP